MIFTCMFLSPVHISLKWTWFRPNSVILMTTEFLFIHSEESFCFVFKLSWNMGNKQFSQDMPTAILKTNCIHSFLLPNWWTLLRYTSRGDDPNKPRVCTSLQAWLCVCMCDTDRKKGRQTDQKNEWMNKREEDMSMFSSVNILTIYLAYMVKDSYQTQLKNKRAQEISGEWGTQKSSLSTMYYHGVDSLVVQFKT